jgi:hypothetical protein
MIKCEKEMMVLTSRKFRLTTYIYFNYLTSFNRPLLRAYPARSAFLGPYLTG